MLRASHALRPRRPYLVISGCLALFAGIFTVRVLPLQLEPWVVLLLAVFAVVRVRRQDILACLGIILAMFGLGVWRGGEYMHRLAVHQTLHFQKVTLIGVAKEDAVYGKRYQLEFTLGEVRAVTPKVGSIVGGVTVRGFGEAAVYRGDTVKVTGKLYPARGNNLASVSYADLHVVERGTSPIDALRRAFAAGMQTALPEPAASFALGLVIGQRATLPEETETQLRQVGLTHIIAVSGYNLTVIVMFCRRLLANRSKYQSTALCLALISIFLLITGFSPPIVRASVVSLLGLAAWYYGRGITAHVLLLSSAAITAVANPLYVWGNVSWYLSFLAFYGVLVLAPLLMKRLLGSRQPGLFTAVFIESLCASVMVTPYILLIFGEVSLVGLLANVLVVPLIPLAMVLVLVAGLAGLCIPLAAGWLAWPASLLLTYMLDIAALLSRVPHAYAEGLGISWRVMAGWYGTIELVLFVLWQKTQERICQKQSEITN